VERKLLPRRKFLPRGVKALPSNNLLRFLRAGKFLPRSAKIPPSKKPPFNNLLLLLEPVALTHFF
jgi:hypothetical protein